jgi:hypothetical protein
VINIPKNSFSQMEKDKDLGDLITQCNFFYAKKVKVAWDATLWK